MRTVQCAWLILLLSAAADARSSSAEAGVSGTRRALRTVKSTSAGSLLSSWRRTLFQLPNLPVVPGLDEDLEAVVEDVIEGANAASRLFHTVTMR